MFNPFNISTVSTQTNPLIDKAYYTQPLSTPTLDLPKLKVPKFAEEEFQIGNKKPNVDKLELIKNQINSVKDIDNFAFSYSGDKELRYDNPDMKYNPWLPMEEIYQQNQGWGDLMSIRLGEFGHNFNTMFIDAYEGRGATYRELSKGNFEKAKNAFLENPNGTAQMMDSNLDRLENPIYNTDPGDTSWYSLRGAAGDLLGSTGFMFGALASAAQDAGMAMAIPAIAAVGATGGAAVGLAGAGMLAIGGVGLTGLLTDEGSELVGKQTADYTIGIIGGGLEALTIAGLANKVFQGGKASAQALKALEQSRQAIKASKSAGDYTKATFNYLRNVGQNHLDDLTKGTTQMRSMNLARKVTKFGGAIGHGYFTAGAEAAVEATQAQSTYLEKRIKEDRNKGIDITPEYLASIKPTMTQVGKDVYELNRLLLTATNFAQLGSAIYGSSANLFGNYLSKNFIRYGAEGFVDTFNWKKELGKRLLVDNLSEGFEEGAQFTISNATTNYALQDIKSKSLTETYLEESIKTLTTKEGLTNIISGLLTGTMTSVATGVYKGVQAVGNDKSFASGFYGYDVNLTKSIIEERTAQIVELKSLLDTVKNDKQSIASFEDKIFKQAVSSLRTDNFNSTKLYIQEVFKSLEKENGVYINEKEANQLINLYGTEENAIRAGEDLIQKMDNAKRNIETFTEYYSNPYTVNTIDAVVAKFSKKGKEEVNETRVKAKLFDSLVETAARASFVEESMSEQLAEVGDLLGDQLKITVNIDGKEEELFDIAEYLLSTTDGFKEFKIDLDEKIATLEAFLKVDKNVNEQKKLNKLKSIKDKIEAFEIKENSDIENLSRYTEDTLTKFVIGELNGTSFISPTSFRSPISGQYRGTPKTSTSIFQHSNKKIEASMNIAYLLRNVNKYRSAINVFKSDVQAIASEKHQKAMIEFLYTQMQKAKTPENTPNTTSSVSTQIQNALSSLGTTTVNC